MMPAVGLPAYDIETICADCLEASGLCEHHARSVLPQLAQPSWVRLIGASLVEQTRRQTKRHGDPTAIQRVMRRNARKGYRKLAAAIMGAA